MSTKTTYGLLGTGEVVCLFVVVVMGVGGGGGGNHGTHT